MTEFQVVLLAAGYVIAYLYIKHRMAKLVQPLRIALVDRAENLLKRGDLSKEDRKFIESGLDMVYSTRAAWLLAVSVLPISIFMLVRRLVRGKPSVPGTKSALKKELSRFNTVLTISILASSPAAALLFVFAFILGFIILPSTMYSLRGALRWATADFHIGSQRNSDCRVG